MGNLQTFLKSCNAWLREDSSFASEISCIRQGTPLDESSAKAQEELAQSVSDDNRRTEVQAWELIRN